MQSTDPAKVYEDKADAWTKALTNVWTPEANALEANVNAKEASTISYADEAESAKTAAETAETNAETARDFAQDWAKKGATTGKVNDGVNTQDYSAKSYAVDNLTGINGGSSKDWAITTAGTVNGTEFSAKAYAVSDLKGTSGGSSKDWATTTASTVNGTEFSAKEYAQGETATGGTAKEWAQKDENAEVTAGEYSAKHWAIKAAQGERFTATSSTAITIGTGSKTFTITEAYRSFTAGSKVRISQTSAPAVNYMVGTVTSYTPATNVIIVDVVDIGGSGTISAWSLGLSAGGDADTVGGYSSDDLLDMDNWLQKSATDGQVAAWNNSNTKWSPRTLTPTNVGLANVPNEDATNMDNWDQKGATDKQVISWENSTNTWKPTTIVDSPGLSSVQVFNSGGVWTKPAGITKVKIFVTGGGSGSSGPHTGGAAGGTAIKFLNVSNIPTATITIGSGGTPSYVAGGHSSWDDGVNTVIRGYGGGADALVGGIAIGGDININGGCGNYTWETAATGGSSFWGGGGYSNNLGAYGSGASGNDTAMPGVVYIEEYK